MVIAPCERGSYLREQRSHAPLRCLRAIALPGGEGVVQLMHVGPGVMGGDQLSVEVVVESGAQALVVAQSAAKIHAMHPGERAQQRVTLRVARGASLEFHPGLTIPFAHSDFCQHIEVELEPGARFLMLERWAAGRIARGERHAYRRCESHLRVRSGGQLIYADTFIAEPELAMGPAVFDGYGYLSQGLVVGEVGLPLTQLASPELELASFWVAERVLALRALAQDGVALQAALRACWRAWRAAGGRPQVDLERFGS